MHIAEPAAFYEPPDEKNDLRRSANWSLYEKGTPGFEAMLAKFEYQKNGAFVAVNRETYNYFVEPSGMGPGPYTFRITDVHGASLVDIAATLIGVRLAFRF